MVRVDRRLAGNVLSRSREYVLQTQRARGRPLRGARSENRSRHRHHAGLPACRARRRTGGAAAIVRRGKTRRHAGPGDAQGDGAVPACRIVHEQSRSGKRVAGYRALARGAGALSLRACGEGVGVGARAIHTCFPALSLYFGLDGCCAPRRPEEEMTIAELIFEQVKNLPEQAAREVLDFVGYIRERGERAEWRDLMSAQAASLAPVWDNTEDQVWDDV